MAANSTTGTESKFLKSEETAVISKNKYMYNQQHSTFRTFIYLPEPFDKGLEVIGSSKILFSQNNKQVFNLNLLESFRTLNDNWNGNGATKFSNELIEEVKSILLKLDVPPKIYPTGRKSIQLEYEKKNGDYIEFEIFANNIINCFLIKGETETEKKINANQINEFLLNFYAN